MIVALPGRGRTAIDLTQAIEKSLAGRTFARPWPLVWVVCSERSPATWEALLHAHLTPTESVLVVRFDPRHVHGQGSELLRLREWMERHQAEDDPPIVEE